MFDSCRTVPQTSESLSEISVTCDVDVPGQGRCQPLQHDYPVCNEPSAVRSSGLSRSTVVSFPECWLMGKELSGLARLAEPGTQLTEGNF